MRKFTCLLALVFSFHLFSGERDSDSDILTIEERQWLNDNIDSILFGQAQENYAPLEWYNEEGEVLGLTYDYLNLLEEKLQTEFVFDAPSKWSELLYKARTKKIDVIHTIQETPDRREYLLFTKPYIEIPSVIIVREDVSGELTLDDLTGKMVAVVEGYSIEEYLNRFYPDLDIVPQESVDKALMELSLGRVDAVAANLAVVSWLIDTMGISNLRVAGNCEYPIAIRYAVRNDLPMLREILDKGLDSFSPEEKEEIFDKWITLDISPFYESPAFRLFLFIVLLIISVSIVWNLFLQREISRRKKAERKSIRLIKELEESLSKIKKLSGLVPICASCKKIRDDKGYWKGLESYIELHSEALFSHGICPECMEKIYGDKKWYKDWNKDNNDENNADG